MFSLTDIQPGPTDIGEILVKVQDDLRHLKEQIISQGVSTEIIDLRTLESAIERTEQSVRDKAEQIVHSANNQVLTLPSLEGPVTGSTKKKQQEAVGDQRIVAFKRSSSPRKESFRSLLEPIAIAKEGNKPGPNAPAPGQQARDLRSLKIISNPAHPAARNILSERYGIALPYIVDKHEQPAQVPGKVVTGSTVEPVNTLPRANRVDPSLTPPPITEEDAQKGILSLIERGLIPPAAELTLKPSPVKLHQAPLHESQHQFSRYTAPPPKDFVGVGGYNLSVVKMDPAGVQAARQSSIGEKKRRIRSPTEQQQPAPARGWTQNSKMKPLPLKAIEAPNMIPVPASTPANELKSVHKFVIQNGKTRVTSQDYLDFKQHYCLSWGSILTLILKLEELLTNYCVPIAFIDGDRLADLALVFELEQDPTVEHFLTCILNADDVEKIIKTPGRRYLGPKGTEMAAIKIQSTWRRYKDRSAYLLYRKRKWAAGVIAISWIMSCKISMVRKQLKATRKLQLKRFKVRAKAFQEAWPRIKDSRRVVIHIPSLGYAQHIRDELSEIKILQNLQMARLCDIADPKVEVIYVSPVELNDEVYQYYSKLLAMKARRLDKSNSESKGNGDEDEDIENRYKIIVPDAVDRFPTHNMCLSSILKYSPRTVKRLRNLIKGRDAYIVPGVLHKDDIYLADLLDIPVLSPEPEVATLYSTKSGSKRIFLSAKVEIPPGHFDIYSLPQLHESLAKLVTENLHIKRWLFKMDNEFDGRGTAFCDVTPYLKCYSWAVKECQRYGEKWNKKWAHEPTLIRVSAEIPEIMAHHATPVSHDLYPTWDKFLQDFLKRGGVIEACPPSDSVTTLSVDVLIEPTGETTILSMADQIHATSPFRCWGYSVPQTSVDPPVLCTAADAVSNACKLRGIVGYFSIDFVTFIDPKSLKQLVWAVDLKLRYSDSMAMTKLMLYVSGGEFQAPQSSFLVPVKKKREESGRRRRRKTVEEEEPPPNPNRFAILSTRLLHSNLSVIHYSVFFQMCRAHGIGFDMKEKAGTIFTLVDSSKREHLGMFVMSDDLQGSLSTFARNLSVIHQEISAPNMQGESNFQAAIDDIDSILGTTEENKQNPSIPSTKSPQLHAPRPKEMQRILQEHQQQMHAIEKDKKEMEEEKEKQRLAEEHRRSSQLEGRVQTGQSSAPPPTPAAAMSPVGSTCLIEETPVTTRAASVVSGVSNALTSYEAAQTSSGNNIAAESEKVSTNPPHPSEDVLNDGKTISESKKENHIARALPSPSDPAPKDDPKEKKRASSAKTKTSSRTLSPMEDGNGKRSMSAKK